MGLRRDLPQARLDKGRRHETKLKTAESSDAVHRSVFLILLKKIGVKRSGQSFDRIGKSVAGQDTFERYCRKALVLYAVKLRERRVASDLSYLLVNTRRVIIMDKDYIRLARERLLVGHRDPLFAVYIAELD